MYRLISVMILTMCISMHVFANTPDENFLIFEKIFNDWITAFKHKDLAKTCELFSKSVEADYQCSPKKNYDSLCNGFKTFFSNNKHYQYQFKLHHVYRSQDLAALRITWYLYTHNTSRCEF